MGKFLIAPRQERINDGFIKRSKSINILIPSNLKYVILQKKIQGAHLGKLRCILYGIFLSKTIFIALNKPIKRFYNRETITSLNYEM